ncbi:MAG: hypothetical protein P4M11_13430 [Candidatus Pacebacteria bacterium]|nr:hypothetical protein [Candidatus Paceibacterota bacterium]
MTYNFYQRNKETEITEGKQLKQLILTNLSFDEYPMNVILAKDIAPTLAVFYCVSRALRMDIEVVEYGSEVRLAS